MTTYLHMKSGDVYEVDYLSIQPFLQHDQADFASYIFNNGRRELFEANVLVDNETYGHITFYAQDVESIEQVTIDD